MHIAICDDNIADRKQMERLLGRASDRRMRTTGTLYIDSYGNEAALMRSPRLYDAFFIDMTSGSVNGFQLARRLIDAGVTAPIVLCVSTIDYPAVVEAALENPPEDASERESHDMLRRQLKAQILYLNKPVKVAALDEMLDHADQLKAETIPTIELRGEKNTLYVHEDEILYAVKEGSFTRVALTEGRTLDMSCTVEHFHAQIDQTLFPRFYLVSEQCLVNLSFIEAISMTKLSMKGGDVIRVSPLASSRVKKAFENDQKINS